jgi:hypothetical protein
MPAKVGSVLIAALLISASALAEEADEPFVGFEARYIQIVEVNGERVKTDGRLEQSFYQTCDSLRYIWDEARDVTLPDHVESLVHSGVWHEKLDGTSGSAHLFHQGADLVNGDPVTVYGANFLGSFERIAAGWEGDVELTAEHYGITTTHELPLPEGVLTPALAYKSMVDRLEAGETNFTLQVSVLGMLDTLDPAYTSDAPITVEIVPSPFEGYELPQTPDKMFDGEFWVVRISQPSKSGIYQLFANGLRGWFLFETKTRRYFYQPVTAHVIEPKPCD